MEPPPRLAEGPSACISGSISAAGSPFWSLKLGTICPAPQWWCLKGGETVGEKHSGHDVTRTFSPALLFEVGVPMGTQILDGLKGKGDLASPSGATEAWGN